MGQVRVGGKISSCFGHVYFEVPFYIPDVKEIVKYESEIHGERSKLDINLEASKFI